MPMELLEAADAGRLIGCTSSVVGYHARRGALPVAATTPRGVKLYLREDVLRFVAERERRKAGSSR